MTDNDHLQRNWPRQEGAEQRMQVLISVPVSKVTRLSHRSQPTPTAPSWFAAALTQVPEHSDIDVAGCRIHLRAWGSREQPPLVLVHGGGAHSGWWDHIAPFFSH